MLVAVVAFSAFGDATASAATIAGTVESLTEVPTGVAEAQVTVAESPGGAVVAATDTLPDGSYSVTVPSGTYDVTFSPPLGSAYEPVTDHDEKVAATKTLNVVLVSPQVASSFSGVLRDSTGQPISGAWIELYNSSSSAYAVTAVNGAFTVSVPNGHYRIEMRGNLASTASLSQQAFYLASSVTIAGALRAQLTLPPVHTLAVTTVDSENNPVSGVSVRFQPRCPGLSIAPGMLAEGELYEFISPNAVGEPQTQADGTARLPFFSCAGTDVLTAQPPTTSNLATSRIAVATPDTDSAQKVLLAPAVTFAGALHGEGGTPLLGVHIYAQPTGNNDGATDETTTAADGSFSLTLQPGSYELTAYGRRSAAAPQSAAPLSFFFRVALTMTEDVDTTLTLPLHALTVTAQRAGEAVAGAEISGSLRSLAAGQLLAPGVEVMYGEVDEQAVTNANGKAVLPVPDVPAEDSSQHLLAVGSEGLEAQLNVAGVTADESRTVELPALPPADVTFSGKLRSSAGSPVDALIVLEQGEWGEPGYARYSTTTSTTGAFAIKAPRGAYRLSMSPLFEEHDGESYIETFGFTAKGVQLTESKELALTLPIETVNIRAVDGSVPLAGTGIRMSCRATSVAIGEGISGTLEFGGRWQETDASGELELSVAPQSTCESEIQGGSEAIGEHRTASFGAQNESQTWQLGGSSVTGVVTNANGVPIAEADVEARSGWYYDAVKTDSDGTFTLNVPNGYYDFDVEGADALDGEESASVPFRFYGRLAVNGEGTQNVVLPIHDVHLHLVNSAGEPQADVAVSQQEAREGGEEINEAPALTLSGGIIERQEAVTDGAGHAVLVVPDGAPSVNVWATPGVSSGTFPVEFEIDGTGEEETEIVDFGVAEEIGPSVTSVSVAGSTSNSVALEVSGEHLLETYQVDCGEEAASAITRESATLILVQCSAASGTGHVTVTTPWGTSATSAADEFTYPTAPLPPYVKCESTDEAWHSENVKVACTASDPLSGLAEPSDASFTLSTSVAAGEETTAAYTGGRTVCNNEGVCAEAGPVGPFMVDRKPPTITIKQPTNALLVLQGANMAAQYGCTDAGSGVASCEGSVPSGAPLETATLGEHTLSVGSTDVAGNESSRVVHYTVVEGGECESALCQTGVGDTTPPTLTGLTVTPTSVNTSAGAQSITVSAEATDDLSGVAAVEVELHGERRTFSAPATLKAGETRLDGVWTASVTLPKGSPEGSYEMSVGVIDEVGNSDIYSASQLFSLGFPSTVTQTGAGESQPPPQVSAVSVMPSTVSTCSSAQSVTVTVAAGDAPAGISRLQVSLAGPHSQQATAFATLVSGSAQNGEWSAELTLPEHAAQGEWGLAIGERDQAGNETFLSSAQLQAHGFASGIQQTCAGDTTPPEVTAVTLTPASVDTAGEAQSVAVEAQAADDLSGVAGLTATLTSGGQQTSGSLTLQSGSPLDGRWRGSLKLPQYSKQGIWGLSLRATDKIGNVLSLSPGQLAALGLPSSISQAGAGDESPPEILGGTVVPARINTENGPAQVQVRLHLTDALSGTSRVRVEFVSLHGQIVSGSASLEEGGTPQDGYWRANVSFPQYSERGGWELKVEAADRFGNSVLYGPVELDEIVPELHNGPPAPPTVSAVRPAYGREAGGTAVTIEGAEFEEVISVQFGTRAAAGFTVNSPTSITATAPQGQGTVDVRVTNEGGKSPASTADKFTYIPTGAAPNVTKVTPKAAPATMVTITGTGFNGVTSVAFGSVPAQSYTVKSASAISAVVPKGSAGTVDIRVTTPNGTSPVTSKDHFDYGDPAIASISPNSGPKAGGTIVTIAGTGFALGAGTKFTFGKAAAHAVSCSSTTSCTATTPAASKTGAVDVIATVGKAKSKKHPPADQYTYH